MSGFLAGQTDFVWFLYGLGFVLLAAIAHALSRQDDRLRWNWLALFALLHSVSDVLNLLTPALGDTPTSAWHAWSSSPLPTSAWRSSRGLP